MAGSPDLWSRWGQWQKSDAAGIKGGEALIRELNRIVHTSGITSPVTTRRGLTARLRYLDSPAGRAELAAQGISPRTIRTWMKAKNKTSPTPASREKIDTAYWHRRRENLIRSGWLVKHLDNDGRGRRMEIHPVDQTRVESKYRRDLNSRTITVRYIWSDLVTAWANKNANMVDEIWDDVISDLDSDYNAYAYVSSVGFNA
ncbi:hypothetical protein ACIQRS_25880 [Streptomyces termitum]|uniref:Transcriptional regulator n=1 Tax=Streptomyces termitum TaxID=67368 RepID=A0A918T7W4_9ACTN|nr:hypothetical protein [Streptomyces termitum]GHB08635.1 hypothetical protein GCM10010305_59550 [Streptomyces termitum]